VCNECPTALARDVLSAFPTMVAHHEDLVFGVARRWAREPADAEDLAQEAFLRAYRALAGYPPERITALHLRGWLARITLNLAHNLARGRPPATDPLDTALERDESREAGPEGVTERREGARTWRRLLASLPDAQRAAVELRHVEGLSYPELAEALQRPVGTVKSDVHRGIERLRKAYEAEMSAHEARPDEARSDAPRDGAGIGGRVRPTVRLAPEAAT